jgi:glycosyltransferase involved in cell wall biosynthesis
MSPLSPNGQASARANLRQSPTPLVSIVMPNLNKGRFIGQAIESVLSQSYKNLEVLVVDNGSQDESVSVVEHLESEDGRLRLLKEPTRGVSRAINTGIKSARGEFVTVMGSDDVLTKDKTSKQIERLQEGRASVCHTGGWYLDSEGVRLVRPLARDTQKVPTQYEGDIFHELISLDYWRDFFGASVVYSRDCFDGRLFDPSLEYGEDWDFCVRLSRSFAFHYVPEPLYGYRVYSGNTWAKGNEKRNLRNKIRILEGWLRDFDDLRKEDKSVILRQLLQSQEELDGHTGMIRFAVAHPEYAKAVLKRGRSSITHRTRKLVSKALDRATF